MNSVTDLHLVTVRCAGETYYVWAHLPGLPLSQHIRMFAIQTWLLLYADRGKVATA